MQYCVTALPFLRTAEQMKGKKKAKESMLLIPLSQHNTECGACLCTGDIRKCWYEEFVKRKEP